MNSAMQVRAAPAGRRSVIARSNKKVPKVDVTKQGLERVKKADPAVYHNLQGRADKMKDKKWKDASGSQGKGKGVYQFESKYGSNVDGYSPIYTPDIWAESGESYNQGLGGLLLWGALLVILLSVGVNLIISTSSLT